ncbi:hypothetical protein H3221_022165 [Pseudomonas sp. LMG 31766]|uniref:Uncharacterized protein n=1 Tax=Pseudomonas chaetocerotis TaxID=2758695 RepID=A0A931D643_9PSED|nr:hypothetical protein [Pseudomonas chaetocerotis]MBZ9667449.1 hypothetical protein [Pseudomonas chaetocerotis]
MARVYHRDQAGAPTLTYFPTNTAQAHFDAFRTVLKACLVSGYGAIPAAGWELVHDAANSLVLRNGSHSGYVCFQRDSSGLTAITVWLAATFTGVDADGKIMGDGVRSGTAANSAVPQRISVRGFVSYSASSTWSLVADSKSFCFSPSPSSSSTTGELIGNQGQSYEGNNLLYCGEDSAGDFVCIGGLNLATASVSSATSYFNSDGFTALKYPDTGLLVDAAAISVSMPGCAFGNVALFSAFPAGVVFPDVRLSAPVWVANGVVRTLRGLAFDPRMLYAFNSLASQALGGPALTTRNLNTVLSLGDGHSYLVGRAFGYNAVTMLLTDNPEFWP